MGIFKRIVHPEDWLLEKDIRDLETEIDMMERQLPSLRRMLNQKKEKLATYKD